MDEQKLARQAMLGDEEAMAQLIGLYYDAIHAFCCRQLGDWTLGADATQDTFLKMVQKLPGYQEKGRFKSWLFTVAANTCRDALRKKRPATELDDALPDAAAARFVGHTENGMLLKKALATLPQNQRECIILRYYHDFALADIAAITKAPLPTVKTRLHRALKALRAQLGEEVNLES